MTPISAPTPVDIQKFGSNYQGHFWLCNTWLEVIQPHRFTPQVIRSGQAFPEFANSIDPCKNGNTG